MPRVPAWIELVDNVDTDRKVYYNPSEERCQWEPRPEGEVEPWNDEAHALWRIQANSAVSAGRNARSLKLTMAGKYYERAEWDKAAIEYQKAVGCGCGRELDAMIDYAHVLFVLWDQSPCADPAALAAASHATQRSFSLMKNAESPVSPLSLFKAARLFIAEGNLPKAMSLLFELLAVKYMGDFSKPNRSWSVLGVVDEYTVKLTTADVEALPAGARLSRDQQSAILVCRKENTIDHSATFPQVEAAVLHMAWLLHRLGTTDGAVAYLEYLLDVPPPGVEAWVLHLLCGSVHLAVENKLAGLACLEAGQQIYAQKVDMALAIITPTEWYEHLDPWWFAAPMLRDSGFPDLAAHAYKHLANILGHVPLSLPTPELQEPAQAAAAFSSSSSSSSTGPTTHLLSPEQRQAKAKAKAQDEQDARDHAQLRRAYNKQPRNPKLEEVLLQLALCEKRGGWPLAGQETLRDLLQLCRSGRRFGRWCPEVRACGAAWDKQWAFEFAKEEAAAVVCSCWIRRFVAGRQRLKLRELRRVHLERVKANAEVLADVMLASKGRGAQRIFKAWHKMVKEAKKQRAVALVVLQSVGRLIVARRRVRLRREHVEKRTQMLQYAFRNGDDRQAEWLQSRCFTKLKRWRWQQIEHRAATQAQRIARGWLAKRQVVKERAVMLLRGRSKIYLLNLTFGAWSLPKKNKRRRLAAGKIQRRWRGVLGRRVASHARAVKHQAEARILEMARGGPMRTRRQCFDALKAWPKLRPGYNAATQCQRRVRGNAGRRFTREFRVVVAKAKASLAKAMGFGRMKTLQRCFRALRSSAAARVIQRQWRSLMLRRMAQETLALLQKRKKRVRRLMRRLLGPIATRALYAWAEYAETQWVLRQDSAWCIQAAWRCCQARFIVHGLRHHRLEIERIGANFGGATGKAWRRLCLRAWALETCFALAARPGKAVKQLAWAKAQEDIGWEKLILTKAGRVLGAVVRGYLTRRSVGKALAEKRARRRLLSRVFGGPSLRAQGEAYRQLRKQVQKHRAARMVQCAIRVSVALKRMGYAREAHAKKRALMAKLFDQMTSDWSRKQCRLFVGHWRRSNKEYRAAETILRPARRRLALLRGRRHATALLLYSWLAMAATLTRRRGRVEAQPVVAKVWRGWLARRLLVRKRQQHAITEARFKAARARFDKRVVAWCLERWAYEKMQEKKRAQQLQGAMRCVKALRLLKRRRALSALIDARAEESVRTLRTKRMAFALRGMADAAGDAAARRALGLNRPFDADDDDDADSGSKSGNSSPTIAGNTMGKIPNSLSQNNTNNRTCSSSGASSSNVSLVAGHTALMQLALLNATADGTSTSYHDARARVQQTGIFVWQPSFTTATNSSSTSSSLYSTSLSAAESAALAFDATVLLVEKPNEVVLRQLAALLRHKTAAFFPCGFADAADNRPGSVTSFQGSSPSGFTDRWAPPNESSSSGGKFPNTTFRGGEMLEPLSRAPVPLKLVLTGPLSASSLVSSPDATTCSSGVKLNEALSEVMDALTDACAVGNAMNGVTVTDIPFTPAHMERLAFGIAQSLDARPWAMRQQEAESFLLSNGQTNPPSSSLNHGKTKSNTKNNTNRNAVRNLGYEHRGANGLELLELKGVGGSAAAATAVVAALCASLLWYDDAPLLDLNQVKSAKGKRNAVGNPARFISVWRPNIVTVLQAAVRAFLVRARLGRRGWNAAACEIQRTLVRGPKGRLRAFMARAVTFSSVATSSVSGASGTIGLSHSALFTLVWYPKVVIALQAVVRCFLVQARIRWRGWNAAACEIQRVLARGPQGRLRVRKLKAGSKATSSVTGAKAIPETAVPFAVPTATKEQLQEFYAQLKCGAVSTNSPEVAPSNTTCIGGLGETEFGERIISRWQRPWMHELHVATCQAASVSLAASKQASALRKELRLPVATSGTNKPSKVGVTAGSNTTDYAADEPTIAGLARDWLKPYTSTSANTAKGIKSTKFARFETSNSSKMNNNSGSRMDVHRSTGVVENAQRPTTARTWLREAKMLAPRPRALHLRRLCLDGTRLGDSPSVAAPLAALLRAGAGLGHCATPDGSSAYHSSSNWSSGSPKSRNTSSTRNGNMALPVGRCALRTLSLARCGVGRTVARALANALAQPPPSPAALSGAGADALDSSITTSAVATIPLSRSPRVARSRDGFEPKISAKARSAWADLGVDLSSKVNDDGNGNDDDHDDRFGRAKVVTGSLEALCLAGNPLIDDVAATALAEGLRRGAQGSQASSLQELDLSFCGVGDQGALALAAAVHASFSSSPRQPYDCDNTNGGGPIVVVGCPHLALLLLKGNSAIGDAAAVGLGQAVAARHRALEEIQGGGGHDAMPSAVLPGNHQHRQRASTATASATTSGGPSRSPAQPLMSQSAVLPKLASSMNSPADLSSSSAVISGPLQSSSSSSSSSLSRPPWFTAMQTPGVDPYQDSDELFILNGKGNSPAKGTQWEVAPSSAEGADNSSCAIWNALLAIDVQTRAAASRRFGCVKWQFELSVRRRLALARAEIAADAAADAAATEEVMPARLVPSSSQLVAKNPAAMLSVVADATAAASSYSNRFGLSSLSSGRGLLGTEAEAQARARLPSRLTVGLDECAGLSQPLLQWQAQGVFTNVAGAAAVVAPNTAALAPQRLRALLARGAGTTAYISADTDDNNADLDYDVEVKRDLGLGNLSNSTTIVAGVRSSSAVPQNDETPQLFNDPVAMTPTSTTASGNVNRVKRPRKSDNFDGLLPSLPAVAPVHAAPLEIQGTNEEGTIINAARNPHRRRERAS